MNQWSRQRKRIILLLVIFVLVVLIGAPIFFLAYRAPTCFDGKKNGGETGIDCGGSCQLLCTAESLPMILKGDPQVLTVRENTFEVVALVENPNATGEINRAKYIIKVYNASSLLPLKVLEGESYVPRGATFAIFEGPFNLEPGSIPERATLEWREESLLWQKNSLPVPGLVVKDFNLSRESTTPRLEANVENISDKDLSNVDLVAIISNEAGNIFAASRTFVDNLASGEKVSVFFSWSRPFNESVSNINIVTSLLPDNRSVQ